MIKDEIQKNLAREVALRSMYQLRNHVGSKALSKDPFESVIGHLLYYDVKTKMKVFAETR